MCPAHMDVEIARAYQCLANIAAITVYKIIAWTACMDCLHVILQRALLMKQVLASNSIVSRLFSGELKVEAELTPYVALSICKIE